MPAPRDPAKRREWKNKLSERMKWRFDGKNNPFYGRKHSEETKQKLSEVRREQCSSEFARKKLGHWRGKKHTEEEKTKISETLRGRSRPDDVRLKIKRGLVGTWYVDDSELDEFSRALERFRQRGGTYRCAHCGQEYRPAFRNRLFSVFCCPECRDAWNSDHYPAQIRPLSRV